MFTDSAWKCVPLSLHIGLNRETYTSICTHFLPNRETCERHTSYSAGRRELLSLHTSNLTGRCILVVSIHFYTLQTREGDVYLCLYIFWLDRETWASIYIHFWLNREKSAYISTHFWFTGRRVPLFLWPGRETCASISTHFWLDRDMYTSISTHFWLDREMYISISIRCWHKTYHRDRFSYSQTSICLTRNYDLIM